MIKVRFFDRFNTLACCEPPREELQSQALHEFGIEVLPAVLELSILAADRYFFDENVHSPVERRSPKEKAEVCTRYQNVMSTEVGVKIDQGAAAIDYEEGAAASYRDNLRPF